MISRWTTIDPLAEKHFSLSAYNYTANNPINNIDPDGRDYIAGGGQYGGDLYTGADAQNLFRNLQGNGDGGKDKGKKKDDKPKEEQKPTWNFGAFKTAGVASLALVGDDVTGVGVADDVAIPFIYTGAAAVFLYQNKDVIAKMTQELDRILDKAAGPQGVQYALLTASDGLYNVYTSGSAAPTGKVWLAKGSVWKYGETTSNERYNPGYLAKEGVVFVPQVPGNQVQIKVAEKLQIYTYFLTHGTLPAGNKIFR